MQLSVTVEARALRLSVKTDGRAVGVKTQQFRTALDPVDTCCLCGAALRLLWGNLVIF